MILGLAGKGGSGKTLAARYLCDKYDFTELTFAEPLKAGTELLFGLNPEQTNGLLKEKLDERLGVTPREVLQRLGDACRAIWPAVFIAPVLQDLGIIQGPVVVSDLRFANEAQALRRAGAVLAKMVRPGAGVRADRQGHVSECDLDCWGPWDIVLANDGGIEDLYERLDNLMYHWL